MTTPAHVLGCTPDTPNSLLIRNARRIVPIENLIIIGGGPAGYTAALYAARANLRPLCIEGYGAGGQLLISGTVENFPGFPDSVMGPDLVASCRLQAERFGTRYLMTDVTEVDFSSRPFVVRTGREEHLAKAVIIATGASARTLGLPSEEALAGRGVAYCSVCEGPMFQGRRLLVIGGGDAALEEAVGLTNYASEVVIVHRRQEFRASPIMVQYAQANEKISFLQPYVVEEILAGDDNTVVGAKLRNLEIEATHVEPAGGVFVAIGHDPANNLFRGVLELDELGYIRTEPGASRTSVEGVFAAGDVQDHTYRQVVTSAGSGCVAALDAQRWLASHAMPEAAAAAALAHS